MHLPFDSISSLIQNPRFAPGWFDVLLKSFVVLGFAWGVCLVWRRAAAATRHLIWFLALASLPLLPLLPRVLPAPRHPLWAVTGEAMSGNEISLSLELAPARSAAAMTQPEPAQPETHASTPQIDNAKRVFTAKVGQNWLETVVILWAAGAVLVLGYSLLGHFQLRRISRNARELETPEWTLLFLEACDALRLRRPVVLLGSAHNVMPLTWGWLSPRVLMPAEAEEWPRERRRAVLLHELAHVKRWDCLTQFIARAVCALYWFNPLIWIAARRMCVERESACDDLVLHGGCKASDYAGHLVQIATTFRRAPQAAGIAMARSSNLEQRVTAIVDASRSRRLRPIGLAGVLVAIATVVFFIGGYRTVLASDSNSSLRRKQIAQLEEFSKQKLAQSKVLMAASGDTMLPEYKQLFDAALAGDVHTVTNFYHSFSQRHPQYMRTKGVRTDPRLRTSYWSPILEIDLAYEHVALCDPKYTQIAVDGIINSIPPGSIYFGGTDPGRGVPTAFSKSHVNADPFYTLTQNALADPTYVEYLRQTYGDQRQTLETLAVARPKDPELSALDKDYLAAMDKLYDVYERPEDDPERKAADTAVVDLEKKRNEREDKLLTRIKSGAIAPAQHPILGPAPQPIYLPTFDDVQQAFTEYTTDATARLAHDEKFPNETKQVKPGEEIRNDQNGHVQVSGEVAVMEINGLIAKVIFDKNPDREFYIEESFPLDWMFPNLEPHGLIMKINRQPLAEIPEDVLQKDHDYWKQQVDEMLGSWLNDDTSVKTVTDFAAKVFLRKDLSGFTGDPAFVQNDFAPKMFSKFRSSIAGVYAWRLGNSPSGGTVPAQYIAKKTAERARMIKEADFAYRQAFAMCPASPEAVFRYVQFLVNQNRRPDAVLIAQTALRINPANGEIRGLVNNLRQMH